MPYSILVKVKYINMVTSQEILISCWHYLFRFICLPQYKYSCVRYLRCFIYMKKITAKLQSQISLSMYWKYWLHDRKTQISALNMKIWIFGLSWLWFSTMEKVFINMKSHQRIWKMNKKSKPTYTKNLNFHVCGVYLFKSWSFV
jgi:hypothetical protein